jgi:dehydrogenase/reductase SDR family protein 7
MCCGGFLCWCFYLVLAYACYCLYRFFGAEADLQLLGCSLKVENIKNKVVWVTGASSGLGEVMTYELIKHGARVVISARRKEQLERVKKACLAMNSQADVLVLPLDSLDTKSHAGLVETVLKKMGSLDILLNNAGRSGRCPLEDTHLDVFQGLLAVNVIGPISLTQAVLPYFIKQRAGQIVAISSVAGKLGAPLQGAYSMSKHAIQGYFDSLRFEIAGYGIDVTLICPGPVPSNGATNGFSGKVGVKAKVPSKFGRRLEAGRFAELAVISISNRLMESWISINPILFFVYMSVYMPTLAKILGKRTGVKRIEAYKNNEDPQNALQGFKILQALMNPPKLKEE